jgi:hypothetical protein
VPPFVKTGAVSVVASAAATTLVHIDPLVTRRRDVAEESVPAAAHGATRRPAVRSLPSRVAHRTRICAPATEAGFGEKTAATLLTLSDVRLVCDTTTQLPDGSRVVVVPPTVAASRRIRAASVDVPLAAVTTNDESVIVRFVAKVVGSSTA